MDLRTFVIVVLLGVSGTLAAPTDSSRCAGECSPVVYNPKFDYSPGKTYTYVYEASTDVHLSGVTNDQAAVSIKANVEISVLTPCEFSLKLNNVQMPGLQAGQADELKSSVEDKPLLFSFADGRINHVCPDPKDPTWSVNIKRGVLSTFQNTMDKNLETVISEVDIAGQCNTHYEVTTSTGKSTTINKRKDLQTCTKRVGRITSLQGNTYASYSKVQSPPLINSTQNCVHIIANNIIQSVECSEHHLLVLFSRNDQGAESKSVTKLNFLKQAKGTPKNLPRKVGQSSLLFDHSDEPSKVTNDARETIELVKNICAKSVDGLKREAASDFTHLVYLVRRLPADRIRSVLQQLESGLCSTTNKGKDTFLSAIKQAGTEGAVQVFVELLNNNRLLKLRARIWLSSLAFIQRPTSGTIEAVIPLIDSPNPDRLALLSVSSLVHTFCRKNENCDKDKAVQKLIEKLGRHLGYKCKANNPAEEDRIIAALKAFGNIGYAGKYVSVIQDCIKDSSLEIPLRLAAIQAFRRSPYDDNTRRVLTQILEDQSQHTEVRIASYLGLMRHPTYKTIDKVKWVLDNEIVNQVSSFIWSHLTNLQKSDSPVKYDIRQLVKNLYFKKKYNCDTLKYSQNYEKDFYIESMNLGTDVESNVIFTPESFLPRSASLNLTVDLFGYSLDLLEIDVRAANFEYLYESLYGPTGTVTVSTEKQLQSKLSDRWHKIFTGIENEVVTSRRARREAAYKSRKFKQLQVKSAVKKVNKPEGSLSVKVFGNEVRWYDFHSLEDIYDREDPYNLKFIFNVHAKHKDFDVARNVMFLDMTSSIPSVTGLPLRFDLNGTASVGLKLKSHFDLRQFLLNPRSADIQSFVQPSGSIELAGALIIDAGVTKKGLKLAITMHSSTTFDGTFILKANEQLTAKLDLPQDNMEVFNIKSDLYTVDGDTERAITPVSRTRYELQGCSKRLGKLLGVELCTVISLPRPLFNPERPYMPIGGPFEYSLKLRKTDPGLQGYHFERIFRHDTTSSSDFANTQLKLSFNTPGSATDREYTFDYELNRASKQIRFNLRTPYKKIIANGNFVDDGSSRGANVVVKVDDEEYAFHGKASVRRQGDKVIITPTWEITRPNSPKVVLTGTVVHTLNKKVEIDMRDAPNSEKRPYRIKAVLENESKPPHSVKLKWDFQASTPDFETKAECHVSGSHNHGDDDSDEDDASSKHDIGFSIEYQLKGSEKRSASFKIEQEILLIPNVYKIHRHVEWKWARFPEYNWRSTVHFEKEGGEYENLIDARWGNNFEDDSKSFHLEHNGKVKPVAGVRGAVDGTGSFQLVYPRRSINWNVKAKFNYVPKRVFKSETTIKYAGDKQMKVAVDFKNQSARLLKYQWEIVVTLPTREIILRDIVEQKSEAEFTVMSLIQWQRGESITINTAFKNIPSAGTHLEGEIIITKSGQSSPLRKYTALYHVEAAKRQLLLQAVTPDKTYVVDSQYNSQGVDQATYKLILRLPFVEGQVQTKRQAGEAEGNFDFKTERRRVVGSLTSKGTAPRVLVFDLKWDAGRDESKKLNLRANILRPREKVIDIKSTLTLPSRVVRLDLEYELPPVLFNGDHYVRVYVEYAPDKKFRVAAKINIDKNQAGRRLSNGEIIINEATPDEMKIVYNTDFEKLPDEHKFKGKFHIEKEGYRDVCVTLDHVHGSHKWSWSGELQPSGSKSLKLGILAEVDVGSSEGSILGGGLELKLPVDGPLSDFAIVLRKGRKEGESGFHMVREFLVRLGPGREVGLAGEIKRMEHSDGSSESSVRLQVNTPFESWRLLKFQFGGIQQYGDTNIQSGNFEVAVGTDRSLKGTYRVDKSVKSFNYNVMLDSSRVHGQLELNLHGEDSETGSLMSLTTKLYGKTAQVTIEYSKSGAQLTYVVTIKTPIAKYESTRVSVQAIKLFGKLGLVIGAEWGDDKSLKANGELDLSSKTGVSGTLALNSEALNLNGATIAIKGTVGDNKRALDLKFSLGPDRDIDLHWTWETKPGDSGYLGDLVLKINNDEFLVVKNDVIKSSKEAVVKTEIQNPVISLGIRIGVLYDKGKNPFITIHTLDGNKFLSLEALAASSTKLGPIDNKYHIKFIVQRAPGDTRTVGLISLSRSVRNVHERSFKLAWNEEENKFVGYTFRNEISGDAANPNYNRRHQILLPSRTIEARADKTANDKGYVYNLHVLLDAVREPNRELTVNIDGKRTASGESVTRIARITVKHPELKNNLVITNELRLKQDRIVFAQKTEFDLTGKKLAFDIEILDVNKSPSGYNYTYSIGIRQPASKLDFKVHGHRGKGDEGRSIGLELFWLNKDGVPKTYTFFSHIDKVNHLINGMIRTPIRVFDWKGTYEKLEPEGLHGVLANIDFNYNNKLVRRAAIGYSSRPSINLKYYANPADINRLFRVHGGLIDDKAFELSFVRVRDGQTIEDAHILLKLNTSRLLFSKLNWRPGILQDIREGIDARSEVLSKAVEEAVHNFADLSKDEVASKTEILRDVMKNDVAPVLRSVRQKLKAIREELKQDLVPGKLDRLEDVLQHLVGTFIEVQPLMEQIRGLNQRIREGISAQITRIGERLDTVGERLENAGDAIADYLASLPSRLREYRLNFRSRLPEIAERLQNAVARVQEVVHNVLEDQYVSKAIHAFRELRDDTVNYVRDWLKSISGGVLGAGDSGVSLYDRIKAKLYEYSQRDGELPKVVKGILAAIRNIKETIAEVIQNARDNLLQYREEVLSTYSDLYNEWKTNPDFRALVEEFQAHRQDLHERYFAATASSVYTPNETLKSKLRGLTDKLLLTTRERLEYLAGKDAVFDPKNGVIEYYIPLSRRITSLRDLEDAFHTTHRIFGGHGDDEDDHDDDDDDEHDDDENVVSKILNHLNPYAQDDGHVHIPPFEGYAMIIADQHIKTYDGRFYDFAGKCSYILTQDLVDNNFTVILNYGQGESGRPTKESVVVGSDFHYITISSTEKVQLDEQTVELPLQIENTLVHKVNGAIEVQNNKGFSLLYDTKNDIILVNISGFYFGKVGGLFGTYDYEPSNDFRHPEGQNLTRLKLFA